MIIYGSSASQVQKVKFDVTWKIMMPKLWSDAVKTVSIAFPKQLKSCSFSVQTCFQNSLQCKILNSSQDSTTCAPFILEWWEWDCREQKRLELHSYFALGNVTQFAFCFPIKLSSKSNQQCCIILYFVGSSWEPCRTHSSFNSLVHTAACVYDTALVSATIIYASISPNNNHQCSNFGFVDLHHNLLLCYCVQLNAACGERNKVWNSTILLSWFQ